MTTTLGPVLDSRGSAVKIASSAAAVPKSQLLDVWIAFFDRTDGRDKLAKAVQNYARLRKHYAPAASPERQRHKALQDSLSQFRSWVKFFKWLALYRDFRDALAEARGSRGGVRVAAAAELVAIGADTGYKLGDNVELLSALRFLPFDPERCERASKTCQFVAYSLDLLVGLRKLLRLRAAAQRLRADLARAPSAQDEDDDKVKGRKWLERESDKATAKARLALLWSLADLADFLRVTPAFSATHGVGRLKKHDGFSGAMGVIVGALGCFKALADGGLRLDQHYVQRWCAPTRTALMTGRYPYNTGMMKYGHASGFEEERTAVPLSFSMLPKLLAQAPTPFWHLGFFTQDHTPQGRGFNGSAFGFMLGESTHDTRGSQVSHTCKESVTDLWNNTHKANTSAYYENDVYNTHMYAAEARRIILAHPGSSPNNPLFLYMAFQNCHAPYQAPQAYQDLYPGLPAGKSQRCFNAMVSAMDESVGVIVDALKQSGMYNDSVIIWSPDNGGPANMANNWPLRGAKFGVFQGSFRTAALVHAPGRLPAALAGRTSDALIYVGDWYVTIAEALAGVDPAVVRNASGPVPPDGMNVWPALLGAADTPPAASPRTSIVHEHDDEQGIYAYRSGPWKLIWGKVGTSDWIEDKSYDKGCTSLLPPVNASATVRAAAAAAVEADATSTAAATAATALSARPGVGGGLECSAAKPCLFNVLEDPLERNESAKQQPAVVQRLQAELKAYVARTAGRVPELDRAHTSQDDYCAWIKRAKWLQPYEPVMPGPAPGPEPKPTPAPAPAPPLPPSPPVPTPAAAELSGTWAQGDNRELMALVVNASAPSAVGNGSAAHVRAVNCTGCCWTACDGIAVTEAGGGLGVRFVRYCKGKGTEVQHGVLAVAGAGQAAATLKWTQEGGDSESKTSGWKDWVKVILRAPGVTTPVS
eukprot:g5476.t1